MDWWDDIAGQLFLDTSGWDQALPTDWGAWSPDLSGLGFDMPIDMQAFGDWDVPISDPGGFWSTPAPISPDLDFTNMQDFGEFGGSMMPGQSFGGALLPEVTGTGLDTLMAGAQTGDFRLADPMSTQIALDPMGPINPNGGVYPWEPAEFANAADPSSWGYQGFTLGVPGIDGQPMTPGAFSYNSETGQFLPGNTNFASEAGEEFRASVPGPLSPNTSAPGASARPPDSGGSSGSGGNPFAAGARNAAIAQGSVPPTGPPVQVPDAPNFSLGPVPQETAPPQTAGMPSSASIPQAQSGISAPSAPGAPSVSAPDAPEGTAVARGLLAPGVPGVPNLPEQPEILPFQPFAGSNVGAASRSALAQLLQQILSGGMQEADPFAKTREMLAMLSGR